MEETMTITPNEIIARVWELATADPGKTGRKTSSQKQAFRLLLRIRGGVAFIACRPKAELEELGRRGICSTNVGAILRKIAHVELQRRRGLIDVSDFKAQTRRLMRDLARPEDFATSASRVGASCSKNPTRVERVGR
jgi:hypothetical protein